MTSLADRVPTLQTPVFGWRDTPAASVGVSITGQEIADRFSSQAVACLA